MGALDATNTITSGFVETKITTITSCANTVLHASQLGFHFAQMVEKIDTTGGNVGTWYAGGTSQALSLQLEM